MGKNIAMVQDLRNVFCCARAFFDKRFDAWYALVGCSIIQLTLLKLRSGVGTQQGEMCENSRDLACQ